MDKIDNLKTKTGRFYYNVSKKYYDYQKTNFSNDAGLFAMPFLKKAIEVEENGEYYYALSTLFSRSVSMFEMDEAIDYLILALHNGFNEKVVYSELKELCDKSNKFAAATYYSYLLGEENKNKKFNVVYDKDNEYFEYLNQGLNLSLGDRKEEAIEIIKKVDNKDSTCYTPAKNILIQLLIDIGQYDNAIKVIDQIERENRANSGTLGLYALAITQKEEASNKEDMERLLDSWYEIDDGYDLFLNCLCQLKYHNLIIKKGLSYLHTRPYDILLLFTLGIAHLNVGEYRVAKEFFRKGIIIKDIYGLFSYYYEVAEELYTDTMIGNSPLVEYDYRFDLPLSETVIKKKDLYETEKYFNEDVLKKGTDERKNIEWALLNGDESLIERVLERLSFKLGKKVNPFFEKILLSTFYSTYVKRRIIYYYLLNNPSNTFGFNNEGMYKKCNAIPFNEIKMSEEMAKGMSYLYSSIIHLLEGFEDDLIKASYEVCNSNVIKPNMSEKAVAYLIIQKMLPNIDKDSLLLILDIDEEYLKNNL